MTLSTITEKLIFFVSKFTFGKRKKWSKLIKWKRGYAKRSFFIVILHDFPNKFDRQRFIFHYIASWEYKHILAWKWLLETACITIFFRALYRKRDTMAITNASQTAYFHWKSKMSNGMEIRKLPCVTQWNVFLMREKRSGHWNRKKKKRLSITFPRAVSIVQSIGF